MSSESQAQQDQRSSYLLQTGEDKWGPDRWTSAFNKLIGEWQSIADNAEPGSTCTVEQKKAADQSVSTMHQLQFEFRISGFGNRELFVLSKSGSGEVVAVGLIGVTNLLNGLAVSPKCILDGTSSDVDIVFLGRLFKLKNCNTSGFKAYAISGSLMKRYLDLGAVKEPGPADIEGGVAEWSPSAVTEFNKKYGSILAN